MILFWTPQQQIFIHFWIREDERPTNAWKEDHHKCNNVRSVGILKCDCNHVDRRGIKTWRASLLAKATSSRRWASCSNTPLKTSTSDFMRRVSLLSNVWHDIVQFEGMAAVSASSPDASEANDCCSQFPNKWERRARCIDTVKDGTLRGNICGYCCSRKRC